MKFLMSEGQPSPASHFEVNWQNAAGSRPEGHFGTVRPALSGPEVGQWLRMLLADVWSDSANLSGSPDCDIAFKARAADGWSGIEHLTAAEQVLVANGNRLELLVDSRGGPPPFLPEPNLIEPPQVPAELTTASVLVHLAQAVERFARVVEVLRPRDGDITWLNEAGELTLYDLVSVTTGSVERHLSAFRSITYSCYPTTGRLCSSYQPDDRRLASTGLARHYSTDRSRDLVERITAPWSDIGSGGRRNRTRRRSYMMLA